MPGKCGGGKPRALCGAHAEWLRARIRNGQDFTLKRLVSELGERGLDVKIKAVWTFVHEEGLSFKKSVLPSQQQRSDIVRKRLRFEAILMKLDARRFYFVDETWAKTNMAPLRGWCQKGSRLNAKVPHGHWKTMTFIAALHHDGIKHFEAKVWNGFP